LTPDWLKSKGLIRKKQTDSTAIPLGAENVITAGIFLEKHRGGALRLFALSAKSMGRFFPLGEPS
jgi:hypothetical protein